MGAINRNNLKQQPIPVVSSRMQITNPDGTPTRSGQLLLEQNVNWVNYGSAADMANTVGLPDGAFYAQSDRSGVLYQLQGGKWHYLAGTMWGTVSPDGRPTDLGALDAGFDYRGTDKVREYIWSGGAWVDVTAAEHGPHASRPAPGFGVADGNLYVEDDRGGVIYQYWAPTTNWHYLAGTMWGTLSPDQRPTDLGANDVGFTFRTNVAPRQSFVWSGSAWIETTSWWSTGSGGAIYYNGGNVGIGTASPQSTLHVDGAVRVGLNASTAQAGDLGISRDSAPTTGVIYFGNGSQYLSYDGSKFWLSGTLVDVSALGIGTTNPICQLEIAANFEPAIAFTETGGVATIQRSRVIYDGGHNITGGGWVFQRLTDAGAFGANLVTIIQSNGFVGIGVVIPSYLLQLGTDSAAKPGTNTWTIASDIRMKRNVQRFEGNMDVIRRLDPIVAEYNGQGGTPEGTRVVSFDAAKLREILPQAVSSVRGKLNPDDAEETDLLGVNTHEIFYHMLRAIQQLDWEVWQLKAQLQKT